MSDNRLTYIIHAAVWTVMFISPLMFMNHGNGMNMLQFIFMSAAPLSLMIVFYANYLWLTPMYYARGNKRTYLIVNVIMIGALGVGLHYWMEMTRFIFEKRPYEHDKRDLIFVFFILRDTFNLVVSAAIATTIQLAARWQASERARREAEAARTDAELRNLRSQINPHFLLNTLNNIYALTAFDTARAQQAIQELSKMLRHILYDSEHQFVDINSEIQFLTNYINLMKIRLSPNVDVQIETLVSGQGDVRVAPMIFISLVENAFKHGVSTVLPSFIHINIEADNNKIMCSIKNSNFPKSTKDQSGHGIGLKQVASRLELMYPGRYEWTNKAKNEYSSKITIYDTKLCDN